MYTINDYETLYNDPEIKKILFLASKSYTSLLTYDDRLEAAQHGLLLAIQKYKPDKNMKFTTYLYNRVKWLCKIKITEQRNAVVLENVDTLDNRGIGYTSTTLNINVVLECLSDKDRNILIEKFIYNKTYAELAKVYNVSREMVRLMVKGAIEKVRKHHPETTLSDL